MPTKARRIPDSERTTIMRAALHAKWGQTAQGDTRRHAVMEQVPHATGFDTGYSDVCVMNLWRSDRYRVIGYELKASRGDLKRELAHPDKSGRVRALCDEWWLLVWDVAVLSGLEDAIPAAWGIAVMTGDGYDTPYAVKTHRKPGMRRIVPEPMLPRPFVAAMVRRALEHAPAAAYVADIVARTSRRALGEGKEAGRRDERAAVWTIIREALGDLLTVHAGDLKRDELWKRHDDASALAASVAALRERLASVPAIPAPVAGVDDLGAMCRRLVHALRNSPEHRELCEQANGLLARHGQQGSPLRTVGAGGSTASAAPTSVAGAA